MSLEQRKARLPEGWWMLASTVGFLVGAGVVSVATFLTGAWQAPEGNGEWVFVFGPAPLSAGAGVVVGLVVGLGQWLVLRRRIGGACWWILASMVGFGLGSGIGAVLFRYVGMSLPPDCPVAICYISAVTMWLWISRGAACGLILGSAQWLILRRAVRFSGWWIPVNMVSWAAAAVLGEYIGGVVTGSFGYAPDLLNFSYPVVGVRSWQGQVVVGILVGVVTGLVLARLLKHPIHTTR